MFNINQVGNRVDISSDGVTFEVNSDYISGTLIPIADVVAPSGYTWDVALHSGTTSLVDIKLISAGGILRNSRPNRDYPNLNLQLGSNGDTRNASGISGNVIPLHSNDGSASGENIGVGPVIANGQYLYLFQRGDTSPYTLSVLEYDTSTTGTVSSVEVYSTTVQYIAEGNTTYMALIEGRKLLVADVYAYDYGTDEYKIYIVDFEAGTATETLAVPYNEGGGNIYRYLYSIATIKDSSGDIHLIVYGTYEDYDTPNYFGVYVYHKNYTQAGSWNDTHYIMDYGSDYYVNVLFEICAISNNRYFCMFGEYVLADDTHKGWNFYVFDIATETLSEFHDGSFADELKGLQALEDPTNHNIYLSLSTDNGTSFYVYEFNPTGLSLSSIGDPSYMSVSNIYVYNWEYTGMIYVTYNQDLQTAYLRPTYLENVCHIMDNNTPVLWFMAGSYIKGIDMAGNVIKNIDTGLSGSVSIIGIGNKFVLATGGGTSTVNYYLLT